MKKSAEFNIELNAKDTLGRTAFHWACIFNRTSIVELMISDNSLNLDLTARNNEGKTGYQLAQEWNRTDVVNLIQSQMPNIAF